MVTKFRTDILFCGLGPFSLILQFSWGIAGFQNHKIFAVTKTGIFVFECNDYTLVSFLGQGKSAFIFDETIGLGAVASDWSNTKKIYLKNATQRKKYYLLPQRKK